MSDEWLAMVKQKPIGARYGSWIGTAVCALGTSGCLTMVVLGSWQMMASGGFVASGGPYQIAHPVPPGFWVVPLAFLGLFAFSIGHAIFASRINAPRLMYATWCVLWLAVGAVTLWYGFRPPDGTGLAWGWLIVGGVFFLVGFGSIVAYFASQTLIEWKRFTMSEGQLAVYWAVTIAAVMAGVPLGVVSVSAAT